MVLLALLVFLVLLLLLVLLVFLILLILPILLVLPVLLVLLLELVLLVLLGRPDDQTTRQWPLVVVPHHLLYVRPRAAHFVKIRPSELLGAPLYDKHHVCLSLV